MAVTRYDLRKSFEEGEANAIGAEQVRADLLPPEAAANLRMLLVKYLDQRIRFYTAPQGPDLNKLNADTAEVQHQLWIVVRSSALTKPTPATSLAVSGANDVLNSQGYTQAAWWNRIPVSAWGFVTTIAICCNLLLGYSKHAGSGRHYLIVLPLLISISFLLIADIDSPRGGLIRIHTRNLESLYQSTHAPLGR